MVGRLDRGQLHTGDNDHGFGGFLDLHSLTNAKNPAVARRVRF
jgi:hypothetical protein